MNLVLPVAKTDGGGKDFIKSKEKADKNERL